MSGSVTAGRNRRPKLISVFHVADIEIRSGSPTITAAGNNASRNEVHAVKNGAASGSRRDATYVVRFA
jgi:hypothetical protein